MIQIVKAVPEQAATLQNLARASKQHWGYTPDFMGLWTHDQPLTAEFIAHHPVFCAEIEGTIAGFYALEWTPQTCELKHLWIHPDYIGQGIGTTLFKHLITHLQAMGANRCKIVAEPHAEGFYRRMGAIPIGQKPMPQLDQILPILQLELESSLIER
jgi:GNAT superfamily N-acetyltransferase